jgi:anthranilate phosphoribosyltransferase
VTATAPTWPDLLARLTDGEDLTAAETSWAMDQVMAGVTEPVHLGAFLAALSTKGESVEELRGLADGMLEHAIPIDVPTDVVDIVGTGGDRLRTVNISTMASLVIAGAGVPVVKHGNRASSSASGSADVLEHLGVGLDLDVATVERVFRENDLTFCFANVFHPSFRHAAPVRRALAIRTAFNLLGPLTNPARPRAAAIGVSSGRSAPLVAGVLAARSASALVFRGRGNGLDELSTTTVNQVWAVAELGRMPSTVDDLRGADAASNAEVARRVLAGEDGPIREAVELNAAAAIVADGRLPGLDRATTPDLVDRLRVGIDHASRAISSGAAAQRLENWVRISSSR